MSKQQMTAFPHLLPAWWDGETVYIVAVYTDYEWEEDGSREDAVLVATKDGHMTWVELRNVRLETDWLLQGEHAS